jgi:ribosome maturation factor RimP
VGFGPFFVSCVYGCWFQLARFVPDWPEASFLFYTADVRPWREEHAQRTCRLANLEKIVDDALRSFSLELVEIERAPRGLLRVFIDRPEGKGFVTVEDCSKVSNQLSHALTVENVEYERLEISSPGLDRVLKTAKDFWRFRGQPVRVRLNTMVESRKRFDGMVSSVEEDEVTFLIADGGEPTKSVRKSGKSIKAADKAASVESGGEKTVCVKLGQIEKARLIPQI